MLKVDFRGVLCNIKCIIISLQTTKCDLNLSTTVIEGRGRPSGRVIGRQTQRPVPGGRLRPGAPGRGPGGMLRAPGGPGGMRAPIPGGTVRGGVGPRALFGAAGI
jgi:hypothetical protein